jgi:hypothetical protein
MSNEKINFDDKEDTRDFYEELVNDLVSEVINEIELYLGNDTMNVCNCYCELKGKLEKLWDIIKENNMFDINQSEKINIPIRELKEIIISSLKYIFILR